MKRAFTLIELLVVIAIIAILAAILFPVFAQAKAAGKRAVALSNLKQLGTANLLYMSDNEDNINRKYWDVQVDLEPYTKSADVWADPASSAPRPMKKQFAQYAPSDDPSRAAGTPGTPTVMVGEFLTNTPQEGSIMIDNRTKIPFTGLNTPAIFGHFARNDEYIYNYGDPQGSSTAQNSSTWSNPSGVVFYGLSKSGAEDDDANDYDDDNAMYFEPVGTAWREIFAQQSSRHNGQTLWLMLDTSAKSKPKSWIESRAGKLAFNPRCVDVANATGWNQARCNSTGQQ